LTAEQLEASRAERLRQNGRGHLTIEEARTWLEETGLCHFLPKKQFSSFVAPSFVEAVAGERNPAPPAKIVSLAEDLLVRLETEGVAVRLNLQGTPGEQPDFVVAAWVLPYVYALRGDRDWRRTPQLTGSRQVSPLAVQVYKLLEAGDASVSQLKHAIGREVSESGVLRAITELWQQLRIIPVIAAPGKPARWQLLRLRFQKAIAEGASTSQVTAISVLASIFLQAVIAASMEEVEIFLAPLTARSKVREVLRGLLATRQVHTISLGHAPHFYVAGTLPEFAPAPTSYASSSMPASTSFLRSYEPEEDRMSTSPSPAITLYSAPPAPRKPVETIPAPAATSPAPPALAPQQPAVNEKKPIESRPHFSHKPARPHSRKPATASSGNRVARREIRSATARSKGASRHPSSARWAQSASKNGHGNHNGSHSGKPSAGRDRFHANGSNHASRSTNGSQSQRSGKPTAAHSRHNGHVAAKSSAKSSSRLMARHVGTSRKDVRSEKRGSRGNGKPTLTASAKAGSRGRYGFTAPARQRSKKRG
jgi:23S rRNA pseudouridine2605 synthase